MDVERTKPAPERFMYYCPLEHPPRYPLELNSFTCDEYDHDFSVMLWTKEGRMKWVVGYWELTEKGYKYKSNNHFLLNPRINREHLSDIINQGNVLAKAYFDSLTEEEIKKRIMYRLDMIH